MIDVVVGVVVGVAGNKPSFYLDWLISKSRVVSTTSVFEGQALQPIMTRSALQPLYFEASGSSSPPHCPRPMRRVLICIDAQCVQIH